VRNPQGTHALEKAKQSGHHHHHEDGDDDEKNIHKNALLGRQVLREDIHIIMDRNTPLLIMICNVSFI
jgi:hypothetical protein